MGDMITEMESNTRVATRTPSSEALEDATPFRRIHDILKNKRTDNTHEKMKIEHHNLIASLAWSCCGMNNGPVLKCPFSAVSINRCVVQSENIRNVR